MNAKALNGGRTRPLSADARALLTALTKGPVPTRAVNPGLVNRLTREPHPLAERVRLPSPYATGKGALIDHLQITEIGGKIERGECVHAWMPLSYHPGGGERKTEICDLCMDVRVAPKPPSSKP